jgi:hypothetical protein
MQHNALMSEDDILNLRHDVERHEAEFDRQLEMIQILEEDLRLLIRHCPPAINDILAMSNQRGNPGYDESEVERCRKFVEKYQLRIG